MNCAWKQLLGILPPRMRREADEAGRASAREIRLRVHSPPEMILGSQVRCLSGTVSREDLHHCVNAASRYSPWAAETVARGYITAPGGHRIGICGTAIVRNGIFSGIRELQSLCIRVARDHPGIAGGIPISGNILILGAPGWGKTTLLRDLCRLIGENHLISVLDERSELFPEGLPGGNRLDILTGCPRDQGIDLLLRTMGPEYIAMDEITARADCEALLTAANCGVKLLATAHAASWEDYKNRPVYASLHGIFDTLVMLKPDNTYTLERRTPCTYAKSALC